MDREQRIREYAYTWYCFRRDNRRPGNAMTDWERALHIVEAEEREAVKQKEEV